MIEVARTEDLNVARLLKRHPRVARVEAGEGSLEFLQGETWRRAVRVGDRSVELRGLVELMDNNPLVCADTMSVPSPAATMALIGLGPLIRGGLLLERPAMVLNVPGEEEDLDAFLRTEGWTEGVTFHTQPADLKGAVAGAVLAPIRNPADPAEIDGLFEECFGRSFYVRRSESGEWDVREVLGRPHALFRLGITPGETESLLRVQVMADAAGKCGAAQIVHAMNVMAGFEESLGLDGEL